MKPTRKSLPRPVRTESPRSKQPRLRVCRQVLAKIGQAREDILADHTSESPADAHLVRLALNEAESLAWQTIYPHLVFPTLADEKLQALAAWRKRQQTVRRSSSPLAAAA